MFICAAAEPDGARVVAAAAATPRTAGRERVNPPGLLEAIGVAWTNGGFPARWEAVHIRNVAFELREQGLLPERFVAVTERISCATSQGIAGHVKDARGRLMPALPLPWIRGAVTQQDLVPAPGMPEGPLSLQASFRRVPTAGTLRRSPP